MGKFRDSKTKRLIHQNLAWGVVDMVIAADYMGDIHQGVINDHGKVIGWIPVAAFND